MRVERLVAMMNDISAFFAAEPDRTEAANGVVSHVSRYWERRMRQEIIGHHRAGGAGLSDLARTAVGMLAEQADAAAQSTMSRPA